MTKEEIQELVTKGLDIETDKLLEYAQWAKDNPELFAALLVSVRDIAYGIGYKHALSEEERMEKRGNQEVIVKADALKVVFGRLKIDSPDGMNKSARVYFDDRPLDGCITKLSLVLGPVGIPTVTIIMEVLKDKFEEKMKEIQP